MNETQEATLESLQAGDTAYVKGSGVYSKLTKITVTKITTTQIIGSDGVRYRRDNGYGPKAYRWGDRDILLPATDKHTARYEHQVNLDLVEHYNWKALSDEHLAQVAKLLRGE